MDWKCLNCHGNEEGDTELFEVLLIGQKGSSKSHSSNVATIYVESTVGKLLLVR